MIRLRPLPCVVGLLVGVAGGIAVNAAPRMEAIEKPAADPSLLPTTNAMAVVTVHPVFTEWQDAIETSGVIFLRRPSRRFYPGESAGLKRPAHTGLRSLPSESSALHNTTSEQKRT